MKSNSDKNAIEYKHFSNPFIFFKYFLGLVFFYSSVICLIVLSQNLVDLFLWDNVTSDPRYYIQAIFSSNIANTYSWFVVVLPMYLITLFFIVRSELENPMLLKSYSRKIFWLFPLISGFLFLIGYTSYFINILISFDYDFGLKDLIKYIVVLIILFPAIIFHFIILKRSFSKNLFEFKK